jgi:ribose transport system substrate-binding protein
VKKLKIVLMVVIILALLVSFGFAGCKTSGSTKESKQETARSDVVAEIQNTASEEKPEESTQSSGASVNPETWWLAPKSGYENISNLADPDKNAGPYKISFICNDVVDPFNVEVWNGFKAAAENYPNLELHMFDSKNKPEDSMKAVNDAIAINPNAVIYFNWIAAGDVLADWAEKNKVPDIEIDAPWGDNAWFFGVDNKIMGNLGGEALAKWINENWKSKEIYVVMTTELESGEVVYYRNSACLDTLIKELDPSIKIMNLTSEGKSDELNIVPAGDTDKALKMVTDWLTAHPEAKNIVFWGTMDNPIAAAYAAVNNQNRLEDCIFASCNNTNLATDIMKVDKRYLGTVGMFPELYGASALKMAYLILEKQYVPKVVVTKSLFFNMEELQKYYPERAK